MKKHILSLAVIAMMFSTMILTSCTKDAADAIARQIIDIPTLRGTWRNYSADDNATSRTLKYLHIYREESDNSLGFRLAEVQNGNKYFSYGTWEVSEDIKVLTLKVTSGARAQKTIKCNIVESKISYLKLNFEGVVYELSEVKSRELDDYINQYK